MHGAAAPVETLAPADGKAHPGRRLTEDEFVAWCDDKTRAEWVEGDVIPISPMGRPLTP